ncbi:MAG: PTS sugar transporter subunit IIB [Lactobacillales bacterium]|jgi:PTS system cellobiose-specific IIB component|nr:PTS sugar transporter subunit IIB [Lactobacillales bacterium]
MGLFGRKKKEDTAETKVEATVTKTPVEVNEDAPTGHVIVRLFCSAGMSTSLFAQKMQNEAEAQGLDFDVKAYGLSDIDNIGKEADVIMIGPQARYVVSDVKTKYPEKPVEDIPMQPYGMMDGKAGLAQAIKLYNSKN